MDPSRRLWPRHPAGPQSSAPLFLSATPLWRGLPNGHRPPAGLPPRITAILQVVLGPVPLQLCRQVGAEVVRTGPPQSDCAEQELGPHQQIAGVWGVEVGGAGSPRPQTRIRGRSAGDYCTPRTPARTSTPHKAIPPPMITGIVRAKEGLLELALPKTFCCWVAPRAKYDRDSTRATPITRAAIPITVCLSTQHPSLWRESSLPCCGHRRCACTASSERTSVSAAALSGDPSVHNRRYEGSDGYRQSYESCCALGHDAPFVGQQVRAPQFQLLIPSWSPVLRPGVSCCIPERP